MTDIEIVKKGDDILTEKKKDKNHMSHRFGKNEETTYNTGFHSGFELGYREAEKDVEIPELDIASNFLWLGNNPRLAKLFSNENLQEFLKRILSDIDENSLHKFLKEGHSDFYKDIIFQLKGSYEILDSEKEEHNNVLVKKVIRSFDGKIFQIGDAIYLDEGKQKLKERMVIGRMYLDSSQGLKIRLDYPNKSLTWRNINDI